MLRMFLICASAVVLLNIVLPRLANARELSHHSEVSYQTVGVSGLSIVNGEIGSSFLPEQSPALVADLRTAMRGGMPLIQVEHDDSASVAASEPSNGMVFEISKEEKPDNDVLPSDVVLNSSDLNLKQATSPITKQHINTKPSSPQLNPLRPSFDFVVGGFPKCGTTTLLKGFASHNETNMVPQELCSVAAPGLADSAVLTRLNQALKDMPGNTNQLVDGTSSKRGFKCPTVMYSFKSIVRLEKHSPQAKFVVGIRHPVKFIQSFYNYRVTEIYERGLREQEDIPDFHMVMESGVRPWKGVGLHAPRFEIFLQQLGKTSMTPSELQELAQFTHIGYEVAVKPSSFTVFVYTVDQLEDANKDRSANLRDNLGSYLGLSSSIQPFGHENKNHQVGESGHAETISICDPEYATIRSTLVENGKKTATWLVEQFLHSPDVHVANMDHFIETLQSWGTDPCDVSDDSTM